MSKSNEVGSVTPCHGGFKVRFMDGGCRTISVGPNAELLHYTNDTITYKENGYTKVFNFRTNSTTRV